MRIRQIPAILLGLCALRDLPAQSPGLTFGYRAPYPIQVSPGQIATFYVAGFGATIPRQIIAEQPLPSTLGGVSARLYHLIDFFVLPIVAVRPLSTCASAPLPNCGRVLAVTLQIPVELPVQVGTGLPDPPYHVQILENGVPSTRIEVLVRPSVHFITGCDFQVLGVFRPNDGCAPGVTHADGQLVTAASPARAGEVLSAFLYGLGPTTPQVATGAVTPSPSPRLLWFNDTTRSFRYSFERRGVSPAVAPVNTIDSSSGQPLRVTFLGMSPGSVGVYQVNFEVPEPPAGILPCGTDLGDRRAIYSNLTIGLDAFYSLDAVGICVAL